MDEADADGVIATRAGPRATREQLLSSILTALHRDGPQSRARLTARMGRNRSTIASLIAELVARGLALETESDPTKLVGRPSPTVQVDDRVVAIAVNPEVDAITIGVVALGGRVLRRVRYDADAPPSPREVVKVSAAVIEGLRGEFESRGRVLGIGVAVPGLVRATDGLVRWAPHLGWTDAPLAAMLADATGLPVTAGNDASLGAVAELRFGAGRGLSDLVYLNGGASGIGGGVIAGGRLVRGAGGYAGEFGHLRVDDAAGPTDNADAGTLESRVLRSDLTALLGLESVDGDTLDTALLSSDDPRLTELVHRQLGHLSASLRNAVTVLDPQCIVLGGFLGSIFAADPDFLRRRVREQSLSVPVEDLTIVRAALGSDLLLIGAAELVLERVLSHPSTVDPPPGGPQ